MSNFTTFPEGLTYLIDFGGGAGFIDVTQYVRPRKDQKFDFSAGASPFKSTLVFSMKELGGGLGMREGLEVRVHYDTDPLTAVFGGYVVHIESDSVGQFKVWTVTCSDYSLRLQEATLPTGFTIPAGLSDIDAIKGNGSFVGIMPTALPEFDLSSLTLAVIPSMPQLQVGGMTVLEALQEIQKQAAGSTFNAWQASTTYALSQLRVPTTLNGHYYTVTLNGVSGTTEPTWPTATHAAVNDGSVVWREAGLTGQSPQFYVTPGTFADGHWTKILLWVDEQLIGYAPQELTDDISVVDANHVLMTAFKRTRDGTQIITRQTVTGADSAEATVIDTTFETYMGRVIQGKTVRDDALTTNQECENRARLYLAVFGGARETITATSEGAFTPMLFDSPKRMKVTNSLEGLSGTPYAITRYTLSYPDNEAVSDFELGVAFQTLTETGLPGPLAGVRFEGDLIPPAQPTWDDNPADTNYWIVENDFDISLQEGRVQIRWLLGGERDLARCMIKYQVGAGGNWVFTNPFDVDPGSTFWTYLFDGGVLPPSTAVSFAVKAWDTSNNAFDFGTVHTLTTAAIALPPPPTALTQDMTYNSPYGYTYAVSGGMYHQLWTAPFPVPEHYDIHVYETVTGNIVYTNRVDGTDSVIEVGNLVPGTAYLAEMRSIILDVAGAWSTPMPITIPVPPAPFNLSADAAYYSPYGYSYQLEGGMYHQLWQNPAYGVPDFVQIQVYESATGNIRFTGRYPGSDAAIEVGRLSINVLYKAQMRAEYAGWVSAWSPTPGFTVDIPVPATPAVAGGFTSTYDPVNVTTSNTITIPAPAVPDYTGFLVQIIVNTVPQPAAFITGNTYTFEAPPDAALVWNYQTVVPGPVYSAPSPDGTGTSHAIVLPVGPTALMLDTTQGASGWSYSGFTGMQGWFKFTAAVPVPHDDYAVQSWYLDALGNITDYRETILPAAATAFSLQRMAFGQSYQVDVQSVSYGVRGNDVSLSVTVPVQPPPPAPTSLAVALVTPAPDGTLNVKLAWTHSTGEHSYYWVRTTVVSGPSGQTPGTRGRIQVSGLYSSVSIPLITPGVRYTFEADAQDSYGFEGPYSAPALAWTAPAPPKAVKTLPVGVIQATGEGAGITGNVLGTPSGTVTTAILAGGGLDVVLTGTGATLPVSSYPFECKAGDVLIAQVEADLVSSGVTFSQSAQYYLAGATVGSAVSVLTSRAPDGIVHETKITAPSGVDSVAVTTTLTNASPGGTLHVTLVRNNVRRAVVDGDINAVSTGKLTGTISNSQLDVITDPTRIALATSATAPIVIYDNASVARAQLYWSAAGGALAIVALNTTGAHGVEIRDAAGGILDVTDGYVNSAGSLGFKIGGGTAITQHLSGTGSNTALVVTANSQSTFNVTVTGAAVGDSVVATPNGDPSTGVQWNAYVSAVNTVTIKVGNITTSSKTLTVRSWRVDIWKH